MELFIWEMDCGVYGNIVVVAYAEESARELMKDRCNYSESNKIQKHSIINGLVICNLGDS